ncbi:unnamed protein product [Sphagnum balticum]
MALSLLALSLTLGAGAKTGDTVETRHSTPLADGFKYLSDFKPGKAILCFSKELLNSNNSLTNPYDRQRLSNIYSLIGRAFSFDENDEAAIGALSIAVQLNSKNIVAKAFLADILDRLGRTAQSDKLFEELDALPDDNVTVEVVKAGRLGRHLEYKKQELYLKHCIASTTSGTTSALYSVLGRTMLREGFSKDAADTLLTASKKTTSPYVAKLLEALSAQCNLKNAEAERLYREAGQINPDDPSWMAGVANALEKQNKKGDGLRMRAKSILCPRNSSFALSQYAFALNAAKRKSDGIRCLDRIAQTRPSWPEIYFLKGLFYTTDKDYKEAEEAFKKNLSLNDSSGITYLELAKIYEATGQTKLAEVAYTEGLKRFPTFSQFSSGLGFLQVNARNWEKALPFLRRAQAASPKEDWPHMNIVYLNNLAHIEAGIGVCDYNLKRMPETIEMAKLYNQHKFVPELKGILGMIHLRPGRIDFNDKTMLSANTHIALADMLMEFHDLNGAIKEARLAVAEAPENLDFHSFLLYALSENNQWAEAAQEDMSLSNQIVNQLPKRAQDATKNLHF